MNENPELPGGRPAGDVYDWYHRGVALLDEGNAAAAAQVLSHAREAAPDSRMVCEALGRALYGAGRYAEAAESFAWIIEIDPTDDYAQFGLGLSATKTGEYARAVEHLQMANVLRPQPHYTRALRRASLLRDASKQPREQPREPRREAGA
jgi:cytochrome c-type biogenesis protein CcmH/NrfG